MDTTTSVSTRGTLAMVGAVALLGLDARRVRVECWISVSGLPALRVVGLPDTSVREAAERVRSAVENSGLEWPGTRRIVVNLQPAALPKAGAAFDLALALAVLVASGQLPAEAVARVVAFGELGLDGSARAVPGGLAVAVAARRWGDVRLLVPESLAVEATLVGDLDVVPVADLRDAVDVLLGVRPVRSVTPAAAVATDPPPDLVDVRGQPLARRALEIAAAGAHHLLFAGPPGCGKTMLARRLPGILPPLPTSHALEVATLHSVAGVRTAEAPLSYVPPFRAPHHTVSLAGLVGGGSGLPRPGEVSLAHRGVLFVDELLEVPRNVLDALRQPLECGNVSLVRVRATVRYPSRFMLVAATNPCPCGHLGNPRRTCRCRPDQIDRYRARLSGPLLDRIDLQVQLAPVDPDRLVDLTAGETSAAVAERVRVARAIAAERWGDGATVNDADLAALRRSCDLTVLRGLARAVDRLALSARAFDRSLRVARTIADLDGATGVASVHIDEALAYRLPVLGAAG